MDNSRCRSDCNGASHHDADRVHSGGLRIEARAGWFLRQLEGRMAGLGAKLRAIGLVMTIAILATASAGSGPIYSNTGADADAYGAAQVYPVPPLGKPFTQQTIIGWHSHYDRLTTMRTVSRGAVTSAFKRADDEITPVYYYDGQQNSVEDYLSRNPVTGVLIARDDTILYEHYLYARTDKDRLLSQSMVKTLTGLLVGIAVSEGAIRSIDDAAATYVPELAGTEYGRTKLRDLLQMSSGVHFIETYQPGDDIYKLQGALLWPGATGAIAAVHQFNTRDAAAGTRFVYAGPETEVLGLVLSRATHMSLSDYLRG